MEKELFEIQGIPAVLYGQHSHKIYLFLHGKCGYKEEAEAFAEIACAAQYQVLSIDLPGHGKRKEPLATCNPWIVIPELKTVMSYMEARWNKISIRANSIGAYFALLAFENVQKALLVSPIVDMERLILDLMTWAGVQEWELKEKGEIPTEFGETLSWRYLTYVREHDIHHWSCPICLLYGDKDSMTSKDTIHTFVQKYGADLTVVREGEHWFHTSCQLAALAYWERENI
nr:alpha/beta hydrolase [uncultured Solibaculum sp.]